MSTDPHIPIIVFVGTRGAGKSSAINMLKGRDCEPPAKVGNDVSGVTRDTKEYLKYIDDQEFRVFDTIGLGEPVSSGIPTNEAFNALFGILVPNYAQIKAIVYVARVGRFDTVDENNYRLISILCKPKIPVVLVLTHAEEAFGTVGRWSPKTWWEQNKPEKVDFADHACIVASLGAQPDSSDSELQEQYATSKSRLQSLIKKIAGSEPKGGVMSAFNFWNKSGATGVDIKSKLPEALKFYGIESRRAEAITKLFYAFKGVHDLSIRT